MNLQADQLGHESGKALGIPLSKSPHYATVLLFHVTKLAKALSECFKAGRDAERETSVRNPNRGNFLGCCASAGRQSAKRKAHSARQKIFLFMDLFLSSNR